VEERSLFSRVDTEEKIDWERRSKAILKMERKRIHRRLKKIGKEILVLRQRHAVLMANKILGYVGEE
jgi:hypothetical protein